MNQNNALAEALTNIAESLGNLEDRQEDSAARKALHKQHSWSLDVLHQALAVIANQQSKEGSGGGSSDQ